MANQKPPRRSPMDLIYQNLVDEQARHMMIFTASSGIEDIIVEKIRDFQLEVRKLEPSKFVYLAQKKGREEMIRLIMTQLPVYTRGGYTVVMKDIQDVYGCMYDLLNKNYSKDEANGMNRCKLFYENNVEYIEVHDSFKIVLLLEQTECLWAESGERKQLQAPFLNRFEKYVLKREEFMNPEQQEEYENLVKMFHFDPKKPTKFKMSPLGILHNYSDDLFLSTVMTSGPELSGLMNDSAGQRNPNFQSAVVEVILRGLQTNDKVRRPSKTPELSEGETVKQQSLNKLASLFSRNFIFSEYIKPRQYWQFDDEEFKELFLKYHPYNTLVELAKDMLKRTEQTPTKAVVFTYTSADELQEYLSTLNEPGLRIHRESGRELQDRNIKTDGDAVRVLLRDRSSILVVMFRQQSEWSIMQHLRYSVRNTPDCEGKLVIFVAHYAEQGFAAKPESHAPITFFSKGWKMVTIDNLKGSFYEACFKLLDTKIKDILSQNLQVFTSESSEVYLQKLILGGLFSKMNKDYGLSRSRASRRFVEEILMKRRKIIEFLGKKLNIAIEKDQSSDRIAMGLIGMAQVDEKTLSEVVDFRKISSSNNDVFCTLSERFTSYLSKLLNQVLVGCDKKFPFDILAKLTFIAPQEQEAWLTMFEQSLIDDNNFAKVNAQAMQDLELNADLPKHLQILKPQLEEQLKILYNLELARTKPDAGKVALAKFKQLYKGFFAGSMEDFFKKQIKFVGDSAAKDSNISLAAVSCWQRSTNAPNFDGMVISMLLLTTKQYFNVLGMSEQLQDVYSLTVGVITLSLVFQQELEIFSLYISQAGATNKDSLIANAVSQFINKGTFDIAQYSEGLFNPTNIVGKKDLKDLLAQFETGIKIVKRLPKLFGARDSKGETILLHRELFLCILRWMDTIENPNELSSIKNIYNDCKKKYDAENAKQIGILCIRFLERLVTLASRGTLFEKIAQIIDSCLGTVFSMLSSKSKSENIKLVAALICERVINEPDTEKIMRPIVVLAKVVALANEDPSKSQAIFDLIQEKVANNSDLQRHQKEEFYSNLNYQLVNSHQQIESQPLREQSFAHAFLENELNLILQMSEQDLTLRLLQKSQIICIKKFKTLLACWKSQPGNVDTIEKHSLEKTIIKGLESSEEDSKYSFALLLLQTIYVTINDLKRLKSIGFEELPKSILIFQRDESVRLVPPDHQRLNSVKNLRKEILNTSSTASPLKSFDQRFEMFNMVFVNDYSTNEKEKLLNCLANTRGYKSYLETVLSLNPAELERQQLQLYQLIGIGINLVESVRAGFLYSANKLSISMCPLIKEESTQTRDFLKKLHRIQQELTRGLQTETITVFKCQNAACGHLQIERRPISQDFNPQDPSPEDDPNGLSRLFEEQEIVYCKNLSCPSARVTGYHETTMKEITLDQMQQERAIIYGRDSLEIPVMHNQSELLAPNDEFEETWIMCKYGDEIPDAGSALLVDLMQHIFAFASHVYLTLDQSPRTLDQNLLKLIARDIELLQRLLEKDQETTFMFLVLYLDSIYKDVSDPQRSDLDDPAKVRRYLTGKLRELMSTFTTSLESFNNLRRQDSEKQAKSWSKNLEFIRGNLSRPKLKLHFPSLAELCVWLKPTQPVDLDSLTSLLQAQKDVCKHSKFILDVLSRKEYLKYIRPILSPIRSLMVMLSKRFDKQFKLEDCLPSASSSKKAHEKSYKLTLASIFDNSYLKHLGNTHSRKNSSGDESEMDNSDYQPKASTSIQADSFALSDLRADYEAFQKAMKGPFKKLVESCKADLNQRLSEVCDEVADMWGVYDIMLSKYQAPLVAFLVPDLVNRKNQPAALLSLKALLEALLSVPNELLEKYRNCKDIVPFLPSLPQEPRKFGDSIDENIMYLNTDLHDDLKAATYYKLDEGTNTSKVVLNAELLSSKWADILFSEAERIVVTSNLGFLDKRDSDFAQLCKQVSEQFQIKMTTDLQAVSYLDDLCDFQILEEQLAIALQYVLTRQKRASGDKSLSHYITNDLQKLVGRKLCQEIKLQHLECLHHRMLIKLYDSTLNKLEQNNELKNKLSELQVNELKYTKKGKEIIKTNQLEEDQTALRLQQSNQLKVLVASVVDLRADNCEEALFSVEEYSVERLAEDSECEELLETIKVWLSIKTTTMVVDLVAKIHSLDTSRS